MTSTENGVSEPPNLKDFWEPIPPDPPTRLVPSALTIMHPPNPLQKILAMALASLYLFLVKSNLSGLLSMLHSDWLSYY